MEHDLGSRHSERQQHHVLGHAADLHVHRRSSLRARDLLGKFGRNAAADGRTKRHPDGDPVAGTVRLGFRRSVEFADRVAVRFADRVAVRLTDCNAHSDAHAGASDADTHAGASDTNADAHCISNTDR
jgi:hypothetical protein